MTAYYNEIDPFAAAWLRELINAGQIAPGVVDERDIRDVRPDELSGYAQCHFFAGIGVWSHALRRAGWPDDRPVWTGSCPCQPFSAAGKGEGFADERHLWPAFFHLIEQCEPPVVIGEQVASGPTGVWFDLVQADLEGMGYAFGLVPLPAAGFGGAHIRDRAWWVADAHSQDRRGRGIRRPAESAGEGLGASFKRSAGLRQDRNADAPMLGRQPVDWLFCRDAKWRPVEAGTFPLADAAPARVGRLRGYGNGLDAACASVFVEAVMSA